ncbi:hypothetical protein AMD00_19325 [Viridibacillus arvi]|uniref:Uncharacterized protein n=1 Tax=Viridibacillus arvi TaxID=263475 RepID=A0A0M0L9M1_9BACL|nr:hypothetical protein AMD00_19325 [Viridibacillus arvi]
MLLGQRIIIISISFYSLFQIILLLYKLRTSKYFEENNLIKNEKIMTALCILNFLCIIVNPSLLIINIGLNAMLLALSCKIGIRFINDKSNKIYKIILAILFFIYLVMQFITPIISNEFN